MIVKRKDGFHVKTENGENLGGPYKSKDTAEKRLKEAENFLKHSVKGS